VVFAQAFFEKACDHADRVWGDKTLKPNVAGGFRLSFFRKSLRASSFLKNLVTIPTAFFGKVESF